MNATGPQARRVDAWLQSRFGLTLACYPQVRAEQIVASMPGADEVAWDARLDAVAASLSIPETHFGRHPECFTALAAWLRGRPATGRALRVWSAGCASGEEAYNLAAVCRSVVGDAVEVLGTDFSEDAVQRARTATYGRWSMRGLDPAAATWLVPGPRDEYVVDDAVRRLVAFRVATLVEDAPPTDVDVVFCRNVLIYFAEDGANRVLERFRAALRPDGILVMAPTDPHPSGLAAWGRAMTEIDGVPVRVYRPPGATRAPSHHVPERPAPPEAPPIVPTDFAAAVRALLKS